MDEVVEHLMTKVAGFDLSAAERLMEAMNATFPYSQVDLTAEASAVVAHLSLPDEDDRHVLAAAVAAGATFLCSDDRTGFPSDAMAILGMEWITADDLLSTLIQESPETMLMVHRTAVSRMTGATDESTLAALRGAHAVRTADLMEALLKKS